MKITLLSRAKQLLGRRRACFYRATRCRVFNLLRTKLASLKPVVILACPTTSKISQVLSLKRARCEVLALSCDSEWSFIWCALSSSILAHCCLLLLISREQWSGKRLGNRLSSSLRSHRKWRASSNAAHCADARASASGAAAAVVLSWQLTRVTALRSSTSSSKKYLKYALSAHTSFHPRA